MSKSLMGIKKRTIAGLVAMAAAAMVLSVGCSDDDDGSDGEVVMCDFGFGNVIKTYRKDCGPHGVPVGEGGYYCDFGQPNRYGSGGCFFRPGTIKADGYDVSMPWGNFSGRCAGGTFTEQQVASGLVPEDANAELVDMIACRGSNTFNQCIPDPNNPGEEAGVPNTQQCKGPFPLDVELSFEPTTADVPTAWNPTGGPGSVWCTHPTIGTPGAAGAGSNYLHCQWDTGCNSINNAWGPAENLVMNCVELIMACLEDGNGLYIGIREPAKWLEPGDDGEPNYGTGMDCVGDGNFDFVQ